MQSPDPGILKHLRPRLAVSACLTGQTVRYDGRHKRHDWLVDTLGRCVDLLPLCPEVAIGLGIPREPVQLTGDPEHPRVRAVTNPTRDVTDTLLAHARAVSATLEGVTGYVFKSGSPSCGLSGVKVVTETGHEEYVGRGVYAAAILKAGPNFPVEEDKRLDQDAVRENFVLRLYAYQRWLSLCEERLSVQRLQAFHARHKSLLTAHAPEATRRLGRWVAGLRDAELPGLAENYLVGFMAVLKKRADRMRHFNVLQNILGHLKRSLAASDRIELIAMLEAYRNGEVPLAVPIAGLRRYIHCCADEHLRSQWYLCPYPDELGLRDAL